MGFVYGFLGVIFGVIVLLVVIYIFIVIKLRKFGFKGLSFGSLKKEIEELEDDEPKQVSGMTPVYLEQILKDFPNFNLNQMYLLVEKSIRSILNAIENKDISILEDKDFNLINKKLKLQLEDLIKNDIMYSYDDIKFHKHAIKDYKYNNGVATLTFSSSLEYYYDKIVNGEKKDNVNNKKKQVRYITKFVYIVDSDSYEKDINVYGLNCPNCGAVVRSLKNKTCSYCKTSLNIQVVDLLKCWKLIECKDN